MQQYQTEQEKFWAGDFGHEYIKRSEGYRYACRQDGIFCKDYFLYTWGT